jgi:lipase ATG15
MHQDWTTFFELSDPWNTTSVFAIRGTQMPLEIMQDLNIWAPIAIPQLFALTGPDLTEMSAQAMSYLSAGMYGQWIQQRYYTVLMEHVKSRIAAEPNRRYYITGHSLGGGLAKIVAMETGIPSVTFSSPGVYNTRLLVRSGVDNTDTAQEQALHTLHLNDFTVTPDHDLVPKVDTQAGTEILIDCDAQALQCHSLGETLCSLLHQCGSNTDFERPISCELCPRNRRSFPECQKHSDFREDRATATEVLHF